MENEQNILMNVIALTLSYAKTQITPRFYCYRH